MRNLRRSTKARIGSAASFGNWRLELSPERQQVLEDALGRRLAVWVRVGVVTIVNQYVGFEQFERHAPFRDDVQAVLKEVGSEAERFPRALTEHRDQSPVDFGAADYAEEIIADEMKALGYNDDAVREMMRDLYLACLKAADVVRAAAMEGWTEGRSWQLMIERLIELFDRFALPTSISKSQSRSKRHRRHSPFVRFCFELLRMLPEMHRRYASGLDGLASEMSKVRRQQRRKGLEVEEGYSQPEKSFLNPP